MDNRPLEDQMAEALAQQAQKLQATTTQPATRQPSTASEQPAALHADDPAAGDAQLAKLMKSPAYMDKTHVDHAKAVADVREYLQQKYQEPDAADLADAPDIGELRRFVGAELPCTPAHAEATWAVVA